MNGSARDQYRLYDAFKAFNHPLLAIFQLATASLDRRHYIIRQLFVMAMATYFRLGTVLLATIIMATLTGGKLHHKNCQ